jgi:HD superfamily phosphohydrolase
MDYLLRDSFFTGVHYGKYDLDWLIQNLMAVERDKALYLGMDRRAVLAFEDFLLSRYHMFLSVYYHATSINFEKLLANYFSTSGDEYTLPADPEAYAFADDIQLISTLRRSQNPWAKRIVARKGFTLLLELNPFERGVDLEPVRQALKNEGIEHFEAESHGVLSKYFKEGHGQAPILVRTAMGTWARIEEYTPLFDRYAETARIARIYVAPEQRERARLLAGPLARL